MANQKATTGRSNSASSGGNPGAKASYFSQLKSVLAQNKRYPRASRRRNEEGVVSLSFVAYADGSVSDVKITQSSGHRRLDNAVLDMNQTLYAFASLYQGHGRERITHQLTCLF